MLTHSQCEVKLILKKKSKGVEATDGSHSESLERVRTETEKHHIAN